MTSSHPYFLRNHAIKITKDADQAELVAIRLGTSRVSSGIRDDALADTLEDNYSTGILDEEDWQTRETSVDTASSQIIDEIERRLSSLGALYPFVLNGDVLTYKQSDNLVYEFLLCASLSPSLTTGEYTNFPRKFEKLATLLTANFLGANTKHCHIGFPNEHHRFKTAVSVAIDRSRELSWCASDDLPVDGPRQGDEGVDYILWKDFGCGRPIGQPFFFGQCACGNDWDSKLDDISDRFFKWFKPLKINPTKIFAVPFVIPSNKLLEVTRQAGLVLDRIRLVHAVNSGENFAVCEWKESLLETMSLVSVMNYHRSGSEDATA